MSFANDKPLVCPSAPPEWSDATIFGVVLGTVEAPRVAYLAEPQPASAALLALVGEVPPTQVLRLSAPCASERCANFTGGRCGLIDHIVEAFAPVADAVPPCRIRPSCRWWAQHGPKACLRCPQIVTDTLAPEPQETSARLA